MSYILILMLHVGPVISGNSNALSAIEMSSKSSCEKAGKEAVKMAKGTVKEIKFICMEK